MPPTPASTVHLPPGDWPTVLDCLCAHFPRIPRAVWVDRFARGRVLDAAGTPLSPSHPHAPGLCVRYFREVEDEPAIPFAEAVLHADADLVVADKPHFLPVAPVGRHVRETLLTRLQARLGNRDLVPLHRIDRETAGLVLFSARPATRDAYAALFRTRRIRKTYEAIAPALPALGEGEVHVRRSRLIRGEPFFRMRETDGPADSESRIAVVEVRGELARYALEPVTGRKHQLRVHMAALGVPILGDPLYPEPHSRDPQDFAHPMRLLARALAFDDPLDGRPRRFESARRLDWPDTTS
ncbi:pseudouridine synthase [Coralloluteibacterium thermophilus]|uniref:Pseudouridine synthase n=1 Tax=Coralloluteibacterium thermophilum TaxID=2707049 RepID=A0ABV9NPZ0_9GAMM